MPHEAELVRVLDAWTTGGETTMVLEEGGREVVRRSGDGPERRTPSILDFFVEEPKGHTELRPSSLRSQDGTLARLLRHRPGGQLGAWIVGDTLPDEWTRQRGDLRVLTDEARIELARVADEVAHLRSWGAHLVRSWRSRWREREDFLDYCAQYPAASPAAFSGGAQWPWQRRQEPPVESGDDLAAKLLHEAGLDHVAAREAWRRCEGACICGWCWRVRKNLKLAPLRVAEALACW